MVAYSSSGLSDQETRSDFYFERANISYETEDALTRFQTHAS